jgi:hypothetical protein
MDRLKRLFVIASAAKQSHLFGRVVRVPLWCDCFAALAMTNKIYCTAVRGSGWGFIS